MRSIIVIAISLAGWNFKLCLKRNVVGNTYFADKIQFGIQEISGIYFANLLRRN